METLSTHRELVAMEPVWNELHTRSGVDHPFLTHEWIRTWWECFGASADLRVLLIRDDTGRPVALTPMIADDTRMLGIGLTRLGLPWNFHTPRLGLLVGEPREKVYRALWEHLRNLETEWELLQLCQLPNSSPASRCLADLAAAEGFLVGSWTSGGSPWLQIQGSWDDYFDTLSRKHRATVRNRLRRLEALGPVELETVDGSSGAETLDDALTDAFRIEASSWKRESGTAILCTPETESFYRLLAGRTAERDWLRLHFLKVGGRRVAFLYSLLYRGTLYALKCGYDPEHARSSPGLALFALVIRDAFERGLGAVDFLGDAEPWKLDWTRRTREQHWLYVFRPTPRTRLVHRLKFGLVPWLRGADAALPSHIPLTASPMENQPCP